MRSKRTLYDSQTAERTRGLGRDRLLTVGTRVKILLAHSRRFCSDARQRQAVPQLLTTLTPLHFLVLKRVLYRIIPHSYLVRSHKHTKPRSARKISLPLDGPVILPHRFVVFDSNPHTPRISKVGRSNVPHRTALV